jgi:non-ribosomal peptide synthetase component F
LLDFSSVFESSAAKWPDRAAIIEPLSGITISYADLQKQVAVMDEFLRQKGIPPRAALGVCLPKSAQSVAIILAALASDRVYIPMDVEAPSGRLDNILNNAGVAGFFCEAQKWEEWPENRRAEFIPHALTDGTLLWVESCQPGMLHEPDLAYILYTSGSTGVPKGVCISHTNAQCFIDWTVEEFRINEHDVCSSLAPFHFDLSVFDLFATFRVGASVVLIDHKSIKNPMLLSAWIARIPNQRMVCYPNYPEADVAFWSNGKV